MGKDSLQICLLIFLSPVLLLSSSRADSTYLYYTCGIDGNYTAFSPFQNNLNRLLLRRLYIEGGISGFYNTSVGDPPDEAFGLFLCRGDVGPADCQSCIDEASSRILETCPGRKNAIIWYDECLIRYSDRNFFSIMEDKPGFVMYNIQNSTDQKKLRETLMKTLPKLIEEVVSDPSKMMYGTTNISLSSSEVLFELVQCFPNLSKSDCSRCLSSALNQMPIFKVGARMFSPSCNIRYEMYQFYSTPRGQEPIPPPHDKPSNNRTNTTNSGTSQSNPSGASDRSKSKEDQWIIIIGSVGAACLAISLACYFIFTQRKSSMKKESNSQEVQLLDLKRQAGSDGFPNDYFHEENPVDSQQFPLMRLEVICKATNNFSDENKLGEGGFGPVYKGTLEDGKAVAVKRLSGTSGQGMLELRTEVTLIARLQHRNLVRLLGCCLEKDEKLLIYEYMPNKSLDVYLFEPSTTTRLDWMSRLNIIHGIARGLLYLHEDSRLRIIHRDLKASNILLDHDMNPKISDFGMARIMGGNQTSDSTNRVVGTYGYMAPEYAMEGLFSVKSDIFSFGVLLLELLIGKRNNGFYLHQHGQTLLAYAWRLWGEGRGLELIDPLIKESLDMAQALKCIHISLLCVQEDPTNRPNMSLVLLMLQGETTSLPRPTHPAFSVGHYTAAFDDPGSDTIVPSVNGVPHKSTQIVVSQSMPPPNNFEQKNHL